MKHKTAVIQSIYKNDKPDYLEKSLNSIFAQSYNKFDYYIGVDGTIDVALQSVLDSFDEPNLYIVKFESNRGLASVLNNLLEICKIEGYDYIVRMDSDDISFIDRFEKQLHYLNIHPEVDIVGGAINEIDEFGTDRGKITRYPCDPDECKSFFLKRNPVAHPTVMFRRSFFEKAGWEYPTDFMRNEDTRLWHEGYKHGCVIANIPDVVLNFRMTDSMFKNRRNGREFARSQLKLRKLIKKDLGYGFMADIYAYATYLLMISPSWLLKFAYKVLR